MQVGETVTVVRKMMAEDKCAICSKKHSDPKKERIKQIAPHNAGWKRKNMQGVFESDGTRETIYPGSSFPPGYAYQGHHCLALSALVTNADKPNRKDKRLRLNYYLDKVGFFPNRGRNSIGLPHRKGWGDFDAFWGALDLDRPLQMHGPGHDESYFKQCDKLIGDMLRLLVNRSCQTTDKKDWEDKLKQMVEHAENYCFKELARNASVWRLHTQDQRTAVRLYFLARTAKLSVKINAKGKTEDRNGGGRKRKSIKYPNLRLDVGPFRSV